MILLYQVLLCQEQLRLLILRYRVATLQIVENSTFRAASTRAGTSIQTDGNLAALSSSMRLVLEILTVDVPQERALLRMSPSVAAIGLPGLTPLPPVVTCSSVPATWARRVGSTVPTASWCVRP